MSNLEGTAPAGTGSTVAQLRDRITTTINGFSRGQRMTLAAAGLAVVGLVLAVAYLQGHGPYAPLYTDLSSEDVGVVTKKLTEEGVDYKLTNGGGTVEVPADKVYQLRADLAEVELPGSSKVGYGILDNQGVTTTDFGERVGFQRAMEGEMAKTIEAMQGVDAATVHLALPKDQVFALDEEKASASVLVKTSSTLATEQVQAITNLVSSGIEGLDPERVSVADDKGHVLAAPGTGAVGTGAMTGAQTDSLNSYETSVSAAIQSFLASSLGPGTAKVRVSADLDFDQKSSTTETYEPPTTLPGQTDPVAVNEQTKTESYGGAAPATAGQLGTNGTPNDGGTGTSGYTLDEKTVNYALNKVTETTNQAPGSVQRLSVAVMVDENAVTEAEIAQINTLVSAAAGIQPERGDSVVVTRMPFDTTVQDSMKKDLAAKAVAASATSPVMMFIAAGVIALIIFVCAFMVMRRRKKDLAQLEELASQIGDRDDWDPNLTAINPAVSGGHDGASSDGRFGTAVPSIPLGADGGRAERQQVLSELIDNQPDEVAQLLRDWLGDRRSVRR